MADLTTAVGELLKKKNTEENLHIYVEGLSSLYKRMAELRLAMNYYTFAEIYSDFDFAKGLACSISVAFPIGWFGKNIYSNLQQ